MLKYNANVNFRRASDGVSPVHHANSLKLLEILLDHGADIFNKSLHENTLLHDVFSVEIVKLLIKKGLNPNAKNKEGITPLHNAVYSGSEIVRAFIMHGADVNSKDNVGETPILKLAQSEYVDAEGIKEIVKVTELLLENGSSLNDLNFKGETIFDLANQADNKLFIKYLYEMHS